MKRLIAALVIATPMANAHALTLCKIVPILCAAPSPPPAAPAPPPTNSPVQAPEIDAAAGTLAIALAGGGLALLARSRRRRQASV
ncbi:VPEID-CTERM sorting domain-containing protein [Nevskia sp.]|uniref:VPEID-CTERM sorting domain-containing protein n=1 Tax=Nevskia sp. TaxID=1929292 RepID=UPI0025E8242A|nr:VPEID-CTERM sorting domain-containing protein [Nevskia sp.]